jgi:glycosyltransferase involved in cell wall biosynthesis
VEERPLHLLAYTDAAEIGGAELCLATILAGLSEHVEVSVVGVHERVVTRVAADRPGATVTTLAPLSSDADLRSLTRHVRCFRALRPDVCHVNLRSPASCEHGLIAALLTPGTRVVAVEHLPHPFGGMVRRWVKRRTSGRVDAHVATSERSTQEIEAMVGLRAGSVRTIYNGVPAAPSGSAPRLAPGPTVGSVGRLDHQKAFDVLLHAMAELQGVTLVIVGDGPARGSLEGLASELGIRDRVIFTGWLEDPRPTLGAFDVLALASRFESFPLVLLEAMHGGVPIVATAVGGVPEMLEDGVTGIVVPPGDPIALTEALRTLVADPARRERLGSQAKAVALTRFRADTMSRNYESLYREVVGR